MSWAKDLQTLATKGGHDLGELCKAVKIELFSGIVNDTRVDTGRLRGNWQIQENAPATREIERLDKAGTTVIAEIQDKSTPSGLTYFANNLPYARVYEDKDAMVGRNVRRVRKNVGEQAKMIRGGR
jgi:hypothetical protein